MSTCKSCGAQIVWAKTASGRAMPLDARPERRVVIDGGVARVVDAYIAHWATCTHAEDHRRPTRAGGGA